MRAPLHWRRKRAIVLVSCQYCTFAGRRTGTGAGLGTCPACGGTHWVPVYVDRHDFAQPCEACNGKGARVGYPDSLCQACGGCGWADRAELTFGAALTQGRMPEVR